MIFRYIMTFQILKTKLDIPLKQSNYLSRKRLIKLLDETLKARATLVCAPAGYGKTVIISEWAQAVKHKVAWISLDESDDDPLRFFGYLKEAFKSLGSSLENIDDYLSSYPNKPINTLLILMLNALVDYRSPVVLVLDDYHRIKGPEVHSILEFLIQRLPQNIHLIISTRVEPPIALGRFRIQNALKEIRSDQLCFTEEEISLFLNQISGLRLSKREVTNLAERTEGWIAGIHIAALVLKNTGYSDDFFDKFSGNHSYIMDFLVKEAYFSQPEQVRLFLLESSILDDLCVELCDAATLRNDSDTVLEKLVADNLFIIQLDDQRKWYRYHSLFSDVLRNLLQQTIPHHICKLCNRACEWYEQIGVLDEAIRYAFKADNVLKAANLIEKYTMTAINQGERNTVRSWLEKLSEEMICSRPVLCLLHAWTIMNDKTAASDRLFNLRLQAVDNLLAEKGEYLHTDPNGGSFTFTGLLKTSALLKAIFTFERGNPSEMFLDVLQQSLDRSAISEDDLSGAILYLMGHIQLRTMDYRSAFRSFDDATSINKAKGNFFLTVYATYLKAWILYQEGKYHQALHICESTLNEFSHHEPQKKRRLPLIDAINIIRGSVFLEWNRLQEAEETLNAALDSLRPSTEIGIITNGVFRLLQVKLALSEDMDEVKPVITELEMMGQYHKSVIPLANALQAKSSASRGVYSQELSSSETLQKLLIIDPGEFDAELTYYQDYEWQLMRRLILIRLQLQQLKKVNRRLDDELKLAASIYLDFHLMRTEKSGLTRLRIEVLITSAMVSCIHGEQEEAQSVLKVAMETASLENALRPFKEQRELLRQPLNRLLKQGVCSDYIDQILLGNSGNEERITLPENVSSAAIEPISDREREVLKLIADGYSNREISSELFISLNTVKSHITSIYNKMGVHKRTQAVSRANEMGLL